MKLVTSCDMGSIKIFNEGMSCFFGNKMGDGNNTVEIREEDYDSNKDELFVGHFTSKNGKVKLSAYDCEDDAIFTFPVGRWFVYLKTDLDIDGRPHFVIVKQDEDIHA